MSTQAVTSEITVRIQRIGEVTLTFDPPASLELAAHLADTVQSEVSSWARRDAANRPALRMPPAGESGVSRSPDGGR